MTDDWRSIANQRFVRLLAGLVVEPLHRYMQRFGTNKSTELRHLIYPVQLLYLRERYSASTLGGGSQLVENAGLSSGKSDLRPSVARRSVRPLSSRPFSPSHARHSAPLVTPDWLQLSVSPVSTARHVLKDVVRSVVRDDGRV